MQNEKYFYSVKLNLQCENCDNHYTRVDNFPNSNKKTKKYFDEFYENNEIEDIEECNKCGSYMFVDEIVNVTEHKQKIFLDKLGLYINDKDKVIPTNTMKLVGITLEGENENNKCEAIILDLSEKNLKKLYQRGKELWVNGYISKYIICLMENDKCFRFIRPDSDNFEKYHRLDRYLKYNDALKIFNSDSKFFLIGDSLNEILEFYKVEETNLNIIDDKERSFEFEIN